MCVCVSGSKPLVGFNWAKNLPQLADGPNLWRGEGFASVANPIQVSLYRGLTPILQLEIKYYPRDKRASRQSSLAVCTAMLGHPDCTRGGMVRITGQSGPPRGTPWYR